MAYFRSAYDRGPSEPQPDFNYLEDKHEWEYDKKGRRKLKVSGQRNINEIVQASLESTKLENILRRAAMGDIEALNVMNGQYIDLTDAPKSLMEAQNLMIRMENEFKTLPIEFKNKFNNDYMQYIAEYGTTEWVDKLTIKEQKIETIREDVPNAEEITQ